METDFLFLTPRSDLNTLKEYNNGGFSIILASVAILDDGTSFFKVCPCGKIFLDDFDGYECATCNPLATGATNRFYVKLKVEDHRGFAIFVVHDYDAIYLFKDACDGIFQDFKENAEPNSVYSYPRIFHDLVGRKVLFKVRAQDLELHGYYGSFKAFSVCDDPDLIEMFDYTGSTSNVDGYHIMCGVISKICGTNNWYYETYIHGHDIKHDVGQAFYDVCESFVDVTFPRFKLRVEVESNRGPKTLILNDDGVSYLLKKICSQVISDATNEFPFCCKANVPSINGCGTTQIGVQIGNDESPSIKCDDKLDDIYFAAAFGNINLNKDNSLLPNEIEDVSSNDINDFPVDPIDKVENVKPNIRRNLTKAIIYGVFRLTSE